jgi:hypothetical protein
MWDEGVPGLCSREFYVVEMTYGAELSARLQVAGEPFHRLTLHLVVPINRAEGYQPSSPTSALRLTV